MKISKIEKIDPKPSRCISVNSEDKLFAVGGLDGKSILTHNSVSQRNIVFGCILRPDSWRFLGIDLKKVELSAYRKYKETVLGVATELETALQALRFGQTTMMERYSQMEQLQVNNFLDLPERSQALLIMVDELGELLSLTGVKALSENTKIKYADGVDRLLKDLKIGDEILDNNSQPTKVIDKYEPVEQSRFELNISRDVDGIKETFISGAEHYWVVYFEHPDGVIEGPETVDTNWLYEYKKYNDTLPIEEQVKVKFKKLN